jgi:hypothetical protein
MSICKNEFVTADGRQDEAIGTTISVSCCFRKQRGSLFPTSSFSQNAISSNDRPRSSLRKREPNDRSRGVLLRQPRLDR